MRETRAVPCRVERHARTRLIAFLEKHQVVAVLDNMRRGCATRAGGCPGCCGHKMLHILNSSPPACRRCPRCAWPGRLRRWAVSERFVSCIEERAGTIDPEDCARFGWHRRQVRLPARCGRPPLLSGAATLCPCNLGCLRTALSALLCCWYPLLALAAAVFCCSQSLDYPPCHLSVAWHAA